MKLPSGIGFHPFVADKQKLSFIFKKCQPFDFWSGRAGLGTAEEVKVFFKESLIGLGTEDKNVVGYFLLGKREFQPGHF